MGESGGLRGAWPEEAVAVAVAVTAAGPAAADGSSRERKTTGRLSGATSGMPCPRATSASPSVAPARLLCAPAKAIAAGWPMRRPSPLFLSPSVCLSVCPSITTFVQRPHCGAIHSSLHSAAQRIASHRRHRSRSRTATARPLQRCAARRVAVEKGFLVFLFGFAGLPLHCTRPAAISLHTPLNDR